MASKKRLLKIARQGGYNYYLNNPHLLRKAPMTPPDPNPTPLHVRGNGTEMPIAEMRDMHIVNKIKKLFREVATLRAISADETAGLSDEEFLRSGIHRELFAEFDRRGLNLEGKPIVPIDSPVPS